MRNDNQRNPTWFYFALWAGMLICARSAWPHWVQDGGSLNIDPNKHAVCTSLISDHGIIYVALNEYKSGTKFEIGKGNWKNYVKQWDGKGWQQTGDGLYSPSRNNAAYASLAIANKKLYAAWMENNERGYVC